MSPVAQEQERIRCACVRDDARDCIDARSGRDLIRVLDEEWDGTRDEIERDEECVCCCHWADDNTETETS